MQAVRIINFGATRAIPTRQGPFYLNRLEVYKVSDPGLIKDVEAFMRRSDSRVKIEVDKKGVLEGKRIQELRKLAAKKGLKNVFTMKKKTLIENLS